MANFRTKARAIDLLGRNQIADLPTAITELWKNGYDAYGDYLDAGLYRAGYKDVKYDIFTISDDGFGMNESDILNKWIVIGTDNKKFSCADVCTNFNTSSTDWKERLPLSVLTTIMLPPYKFRFTTLFLPFYHNSESVEIESFPG